MTVRQLATVAEAADWLRQRVTGHLETDSRVVGAGDGFLAWAGLQVDARQFVATALQQGAGACLVEQRGIECFDFGGNEAVASFVDLKAACGRIADDYYGHPSQALHVVAITGTNGKTSTAWWLAQALTRLGRADLSPCALSGTLGMGVLPDLQADGLTTPGPVRMQAHVREWADAKVQSLVLEASSIGLAEHRLDGLAMDVAVFTNFSQDHLDYHGDMAAYWQAKEALFAWPGLRAAVVNLDDAQGPGLVEFAHRHGLDVWGWTLEGAPGARLQARDVAVTGAGMRWTVCEDEMTCPVETALVGRYNVANVMAVLAVLRALGVALADAVDACAGLLAVPGRMERVELPGAPLVVVDFAHTSDALQNVLQALAPLAQARGGSLWCVFGCGGERDHGKRPMMARVAERGADRVVVTSDNPRGEAPAVIIDEICAGFARPQAVRVEADRACAIADAVRAAAANDVVLLAGKGHEQTQEINGVQRPFSDRDHAMTALQARQPGNRVMA